jgi:hypothetical protein
VSQQAELQQQRQSGGLLQWLLPALCFRTAAFPVADGSNGEGGPHVQLTKAASAPASSFPQPHKQSSACSSSASSDGGAPASNLASIPASSSLQSMRSNSWHTRRSSWRKSARAGALAAAQQQQQQQQDPSVLRIVARCDSFQAYFRGQYAQIEQQLAMLEASCGWSTLQPPCKQQQQDGDHLDSGPDADQQQQQQRAAADSRKVSSTAGAAISVSVGPLVAA